MEHLFGNANDDREYFILPEEAIQYLPPEWRDQILALKDDGLATLEAVDKDIKNLIRLAKAFPAAVSLRYIYSRLAEAEFGPSIDTVLEHEMLTLAFAVAYARVVDGGQGSGVARDKLPVHLRQAHDEIRSLRNQRFAHNGEHESIEGAIEFGFQNGRFDVNLSFRLGYYIRGASEWGQLVDFIDGLMYDRLKKQLEILTRKTGREWVFPSGPRPTWIRPAEPDSPS